MLPFLAHRVETSCVYGHLSIQLLTSPSRSRDNNRTGYVTGHAVAAYLTLFRSVPIDPLPTLPVNKHDLRSQAKASSMNKPLLKKL